MTPVIRISAAALVPLLALFASACAQPNRCGTNGEYCCVDEAGGGYCLGTDLIGGVALRCDVATVTCEPSSAIEPLPTETVSTVPFSRFSEPPSSAPKLLKV